MQISASLFLSRLSFRRFINLVFKFLFLFFSVLFLTLFLIFLAALVSHYVSPFSAVQNIFSKHGFCCNHCRPVIIIFNLAYFSKSVNPAIWNPPASAGGEMRCNPREVALSSISQDNSTGKLQSQMTFRLCTLFLKLGSHYYR